VSVQSDSASDNASNNHHIRTQRHASALTHGDKDLTNGHTGTRNTCKYLPYIPTEA